MAKTTVTIITADIKALVDYDITDTALDAIILVQINLIIKRMKQWFMDESLFDEITEHDTFSTVASQEYIQLSTETVDFDQQIVLSERTNDSTIDIITFKQYRQLFPDPTANSAVTPDVAAFFNNRIYFGPTPSGVITIFLDYVKLITKLTSGGTLPYEDKYDEVVIAGVIEYLVKFLDRANVAMIRQAKFDFREVKHDLITGASKNIGMNNQSQSRVPSLPFFSPRKVV